MSTLGGDDLKRHPELAILTALDRQLPLVVETLTVIHGGGPDSRALHCARDLARAVRELQRRIAAYGDVIRVAPASTHPSQAPSGTPAKKPIDEAREAAPTAEPRRGTRRNR